MKNYTWLVLCIFILMVWTHYSQNVFLTIFNTFMVKKLLKVILKKHLTFGPFFSSQPFLKPQMLSNIDNLYLLHMIFQNFRFRQNNSNEIAQTQSKISFTINNELNLVSHIIQGQSIFLKNNFTFVLHFTQTTYIARGCIFLHFQVDLICLKRNSKKHYLCLRITSYNGVCAPHKFQFPIHLGSFYLRSVHLKNKRINLHTIDDI